MPQAPLLSHITLTSQNKILTKIIVMGNKNSLMIIKLIEKMQ